MEECNVCGNGVADEGEDCEITQSQCPANCQCPTETGWNPLLEECNVCGNGVTDEGEDCEIT